MHGDEQRWVDEAKDELEDVEDLEQDVLAMVEDGWTQQEIAERLGTTIHRVRCCVASLRKKGWLKENGKKKREIEERMEIVFKAVKEGHQVMLAAYLGMKEDQVRYVLEKLAKAGRIRKDNGAWVVAE